MEIEVVELFTKLIREVNKEPYQPSTIFDFLWLVFTTLQNLSVKRKYSEKEKASFLKNQN